MRSCSLLRNTNLSNSLYVFYLKAILVFTMYFAPVKATSQIEGRGEPDSEMTSIQPWVRP
ncbi:MAG: hypothetical protein IPN29_17395 [Saprospiraceae bacterium]|nr:hypothetical protein [Saprospiraceae bacterium]